MVFRQKKAAEWEAITIIKCLTGIVYLSDCCQLSTRLRQPQGSIRSVPGCRQNSSAIGAIRRKQRNRRKRRNSAQTTQSAQTAQVGAIGANGASWRNSAQSVLSSAFHHSRRIPAHSAHSSAFGAFQRTRCNPAHGQLRPLSPHALEIIEIIEMGPI